jgi:O-antigen/teichoic acid export membrane protein
MSSNPSVSIAAKIREVGVHSVIYGFGSVAQSAVQFLLIPVLTATLATVEFGAYSLIQMASVIAGAVCYLGITSALPRSYFDYDDEQERRSVFTTAFLLLLAGAVAQAALGELGGRWISRALLQTDRYHVEVFWALLGSALSFINQFFFTYLRFLRRSIASILLSILALIGSIGLTLLLLHRNAKELSAPFRGIACAQAAVFIVFVLVYGRRAFTTSLNEKEVSILLKFGVPTMVTSFAAMSIDWVDRIFIQRMLTVQDVGVYSVGYKLGSVVNTILVTPFTQIWNPMMMEYRTHGNITEFFSRIVSYYFLASSLILVTACIFVREALPLVARSADYLAASPVILLVMTGYLLNGSTNILAAGLMYERQILRIAVVYYAIAAGNIGLNFYFIPHFGIIGAAMTSLLTYALMPVLIYLQASRYFPIRFEAGRLLRMSAVAAFALFFGLFIDRRLAVPLVGKVGLFLVLASFLGVFCTDADEKRRVRRLIDRRV